MSLTRIHIVFLFLLTVTTILARPFIVFSSPILQHILEQEMKAYGYAKTVRKRKETIYTVEEFTLIEHQSEKFEFLPLQLLLTTLHKWLKQQLLLLSFLFAYLLSLSRSIRSYFDVTPQTDRYRTGSVFLI